VHTVFRIIHNYWHKYTDESRSSRIGLASADPRGELRLAWAQDGGATCRPNTAREKQRLEQQTDDGPAKAGQSPTSASSLSLLHLRATRSGLSGIASSRTGWEYTCSTYMVLGATRMAPGSLPWTVRPGHLEIQKTVLWRGRLVERSIHARPNMLPRTMWVARVSVPRDALRIPQSLTLGKATR
jgi:hypothetical protein